MIPKATENTITHLLAEELQKIGVESEPLAKIQTPTGERYPDIICKNSGSYPIEAKFSEAELVEAIAKLQNDYLKHHEVLGVEGGFALLYPKELAEPMPPEAVRNLAHKLEFKLVAMFSPKDPRPFRVDEGNIDEISRIISEYILKPTKPIEPSVEFIIKSLREAATYLRNGLRYATAADLETFFGGRGVFENILQYEEKETPVEELKSAAAFILVNQLLFYHVLSKLRPQFREIDPDKIQNPSDLKEYFGKVLEVNYRPIFFYDATPYIPESFVKEVRAIISVIGALSVEKIGADVLGTIFHDLIPFKTRKSVAAFYTNVLAAELLASLSIDDPDAKVTDLAVGSGGLLVAAYRRKRELLKEPFKEAIHRRFVGVDLLGIDVMPFAASIAASHLALQSPQYFTNRVKIAIWDSTELKPYETIPSAAGLRHVLDGQAYLESFLPMTKRTKGVVEVGEGAAHNIEVRPCDVIIMNPPFTRQERIPDNYKEILLDRFKDYKDYLHGQLGYHGYFILLADKFLKDDGRMALVLPATVLRVKSYEGIRKLLAQKYHVEYIITTWHRSAFSESTMFREILFVARKAVPSKDAKTKIIVLKKLPTTPIESREMAAAIRRSKADWEDDKLIVKIYDYSELTSDTNNWFKYISAREPALADVLNQTFETAKLVPFSSLAEAQESDLRHYKFKEFHGFILADVSRAKKKIDAWVAERLTRSDLVARHKTLGTQAEIPLRILGRGLRRNSSVKSIDVSEISDYLILSYFKGIEDLARTFLMDKDMMSLSPKIDEWRRKFEARKCHLLLARRFDISAPGTCLLAFYSDVPIVGVDMWCIQEIHGDIAKILSLWLNSSFSILQFLLLRTETRGAWMKIHNYMLAELLVPDFTKLPDGKRKILLKAFNKIKDSKFPSILEQLKQKYPARKLIDQTWLEALGYKGNKEELLDKLYGSLVSEINLLKKIMAEGAQ